MTRSCEKCSLWTKPKGDSKWGLCKPTPQALPFWAFRHETDMQTQTLVDEGGDCAAYLG